MYRGFKLQLSDKLGLGYHNEGERLYNNNKLSVKQSLDKYISKDGSLSASDMEKDWFPQVDAHVFISHSHNNKDIAMSLAGFLFYKFGLNSFIDSSIWGYANDLLRLIDDEYCPSADKKTYNYHKRNITTSHVHMMLSNALLKMIDKTECLFFLETPSSVSVKESFAKTASPWIYTEINISKYIRINNPDRLRVIRETRRFDESIEKADKNLPSLLYNLDLNHLTEIGKNDLDLWCAHFELSSNEKGVDALDELYSLHINQ